MFVFQLHEEKIAAIQEKLELSEQKLTQYSKLPEMEEQLKARMEALNQVGSQVGNVSKKDVFNEHLPNSISNNKYNNTIIFGVIQLFLVHFLFYYNLMMLEYTIYIMYIIKSMGAPFAI